MKNTTTTTKMCIRDRVRIVSYLGYISLTMYEEYNTLQTIILESKIDGRREIMNRKKISRMRNVKEWTNEDN